MDLEGLALGYRKLTATNQRIKGEVVIGMEKSEKYKKHKIDEMVADAVRMPVIELSKRYGYSWEFITKTLKQQKVTPKVRWGG